MPARPKIPDPSSGQIASFAHDLRLVAADNAPIPFIADRCEGRPSRAALYAALSGTRVPSHTTVATLLRWWLGDPAAEQPDPGGFHDHAWGWIDRLPNGHPTKHLARQWQARHQQLIGQAANSRASRAAAPPVTIEAPPEQRRFIASLQALLEKQDAVGEGQWRLGQELYRMEGYLSGRRIPSADMLWTIVTGLAMTHDQDPEADDVLDSYDRLATLATQARASRTRARRRARAQRAARQPSDGS